MRLSVPGLLIAVGLLACPCDAHIHASPITTRLVFVSVVDKSGQFVDDLKPTDFVVKEGGQVRDVIGVEPARVPTRIVILFEEGLTRDTDVKLAVIRLIQRMQDRAEMSIVVAGLANTTVVPFSGNGATLVVGLNALSRSPRPVGGHIVEGILEAAKSLGAGGAERRLVIALTVDADELGSTQPDEVLTALRDTGTSLYAIALRGPAAPTSLGTLIEANGRSQVLGDGSSQSGGRLEVLTKTTGFPAAMISVADEILHQHKLTYQLPDGVKRSSRLEVSVARPGLRLRAPTRIAD